MSEKTIWTKEKTELVRKMVPPDINDDEFRVFMHHVERTGLDPLTRQIYCSNRWNKDQGRKVMVVQTPIDGFRLIAERTGKYAGQLGPFWCGDDGEWHDVWLSNKPPVAAKVGVMRHDFKEPLYSVARYSSYVQTTKDGHPNQFWGRMPDLMTAKCAEALALRRAFPQELSGIYTADEIPNEEPIHPPDPEPNCLDEAKESLKNTPPRLSQKQLMAKMADLGKQLEALGERGVMARDEARAAFAANKTYEGALQAVAFMESVIAGLSGEASYE